VGGFGLCTEQMSPVEQRDQWWTLKFLDHLSDCSLLKNDLSQWTRT